MFFHLIDATIVNAYILYSQSTQSSPTLTHVKFQIELAKGLLQEIGEEIESLSIDARLQSGTWSEAIPPPL